MGKPAARVTACDPRARHHGPWPRLGIVLALTVLLSGLATAQSTLTAQAGADKTVNVGDTIRFDGMASTGDIASYNWDFGDGNTGSGPTPTHRYANGGTYTVTLAVVSPTGQVATDTVLITARTIDSVAPTIRHQNVTTATVSRAIPITATVLDNVQVQSVSVLYKNSTGSAYVESPLTKEPGTSTYRGSIPAAAVSGISVSYYLRVQDTRTPTPNTALHPAGAPMSVITVPLADTTPPTLTESPPPTSAFAGSTLAVTATIGDNVGVATSTLHYRFGTSGPFTTASLTLRDGMYTGTITIPSSRVSIVQYYLEATDAAGNTARAPAAAPGSPHTVGVTSATAPTLSHSGISQATAGSPIPIRVLATAADGRTLAAVNVTYRTLGATAWVTVPMSPGGGTYTATLPGAAVTDRGLEYYVTATDDTGTTAHAPAAGAATPQQVTTPPGLPTSVTLARAPNGVQIAWTAPPTSDQDSVATYRIYRARAADAFGTTPLAAEPTASQYLDTSAAIGVEYYYRVAAVDAHGTQGAHSAVAGPVEKGSVLPAPSVTLAPAGDGAVRASWDAVEGAASYTAAFTRTQDGRLLGTQTTSGLAVSLAGLPHGVPVTVTVTATNAYGETGVPGTATGSPVGLPPAPRGLTATRNTPDAVVLTWTALPSTREVPVTGYRIERAPAPDGQFIRIATIADSTRASYTDLGATPGTAFTYRVLATQPAGDGPASAPVTSTKGVRPGVPFITSITAHEGRITLGWTPVAEAGHYHVETMDDAGTWSRILTTQETSASFSPGPDRAAGYVRVTALNGHHERGPPSVPATLPSTTPDPRSDGADTTRPAISTHAPTGTTPPRPTFSVTYTDNVGIDTAATRLHVNGVEVPALVGATSLTWNPPGDLEPGRHTARVVVTDTSGHVRELQWTFTVDGTGTAPTPALNFSEPTVQNAKGIFLKTVRVGETVTLSVTYAHSGDSAGDFPIHLRVNGELVASEMLRIEPAGTGTVAVTYAFPAEGTYLLQVNDRPPVPVLVTSADSTTPDPATARGEDDPAGLGLIGTFGVIGAFAILATTFLLSGRRLKR